MSMNDYTSHGYGLYVRDVPISSDGIRNMISKIPALDIELRSMKLENITYDTATEEQLMNDFLANSEIIQNHNYTDGAPDEDNLYVYVAMTIGIKETDDVYLSLCRDDDNGWGLMLMSAPPWEYNESEKCMTEEKFKEILSRWFSFLTNTDISNEIDSIHPTYCG